MKQIGKRFFMKKKLILINVMLVSLLIGGCGSKNANNTQTNTQTSTQNETQTITQTKDETPVPDNDGVEGPSNNGDEELIVDDDGIFSDYYRDALEKLRTMTLEEKVGQIFLARCPIETDITSIQQYHLGGYVLFKRDFEGKTTEDVINTITSYQEISKIPLIIATDEEGGSVVRVSSNSNLSKTKFNSPQTIYQSGGFKAIYNDSINKANLLKTLGINLNLAPVSDIASSSEDYIFDRTFGLSAEETGEFVQNVVKATKEVGIGSCLKHFPGYGGNVDTHTGMAVDSRPYSSFETSDFLPFIAGIETGVETILVSHNIVEAIDSSYPASLSPEVNKVLRERLGFTGVIITDDLEMDAIKQYTNGQNPAVSALNAGNSMLIITDFEEGYQAVLEAIKNGEISEELLDKAVFRILALKYSLGLIQ
jgi:beta-N-acetylhexosaminidase